jgi:fluoride exporter
VDLVGRVTESGNPTKQSGVFNHERDVVSLVHTAAQERAAVMKYLLVGAGGFLGAIARFWLGGYVYDRLGTRFPYGTFVVNCSGCFAIGIIMAILTERVHLHANWRYLVPIGFIGAYTTFSTFEYETLMSFREGAFVTGFLNVFLSVVVGFIFVWLGMICGKAMS